MGFIEFKNVTYTYPLGKKPALKILHVYLKKGNFMGSLEKMQVEKQHYVI